MPMYTSPVPIGEMTASMSRMLASQPAPMAAIGTAGSAAIAGLRWSDYLSAYAGELKKQGRSCILLWMAGGPSQFESFDMKPDAPAEIRGDFKPIKTNVPGIGLTDLLPHTLLRGNARGETP